MCGRKDDRHSQLLMAYSEWLDTSGIIRSESETDDKRPRVDLVAAFLAERGAGR